MHPTPENASSRASHRVIVLLLLIAALVPFAQTLGYGYMFDDTTVIRSNPDLSGWDAIGKVWTVPYGGFRSQGSGLYRPVPMMLFALVWNAGRHWALWFHVLVVAMHMAAAVVVWRLLVPGCSRWPAVLAALWFAVHPVHVEAVASIANSAEIMVALWTGALALYLARTREREGPIPWSQAAVCGALYLAAFLSKESGAVAPILAAIWLWGWRRPLSATPLSKPRDAFGRWWRVLAMWSLAALIVFTLRTIVLDAPLPGRRMVAPGLIDLSAPQRIWVMLSLGPTILRQLVWPSILSPHYGPSAFPRGDAHLWAAVTIALVVLTGVIAVALARRGDRRIAAALGWMMVAFLPASNLIVATGQILAERTLYVPSIGVAMLIGASLDALWLRWSAPRARQAVRAAAIAVASCVVAVFGVRATRSASVWRSHSTLFAQMIAADSGGYRGYWMAGMDARYSGRMAEGLALLAKAYALYPRDRALLVDYSAALSRDGDHVRGASVAAELMAWPDLRRDPQAVAFYLAAVGRAYGPDSLAAAARRLTSR